MTVAPRLKDAVVEVHVTVLKQVAGIRPLPVGYWSRVRRITALAFSGPDILLPAPTSLRTTGASLDTPELRELLRTDTLGAWALDRASVEFLWADLLRRRPRCIIECGAGASTLVLAKYAARAAQEVMVISLEQSPSVVEQVEQRLAAAGLRDHCQVIHVPISTTGEYRLDPQVLIARVGPVSADWILIDGPAGPTGCRRSTLPQLMAVASPGARWFLDDALRDGELRILEEWQRNKGIHVDGIHPFGKGLATGTLELGAATALG